MNRLSRLVRAYFIVLVVRKPGCTIETWGSGRTSCSTLSKHDKRSFYKRHSVFLQDRASGVYIKFNLLSRLRVHRGLLRKPKYSSRMVGVNRP